MRLLEICGEKVLLSERNGGGREENLTCVVYSVSIT